MIGSKFVLPKFDQNNGTFVPKGLYNTFLQL